MNDRFTLIRSQSPINRRQDRQDKQTVPTYQANLFKEVALLPKPKTPVPYVQRNKPLMTLRLDLGPRVGTHSVHVYKEDVNASQVAERCLNRTNAL